jgi:biopolymer transport protein ExbB
VIKYRIPTIPLLLAALAFLAAPAALGQTPPGNPGLDRAAERSQKELDRALAELTELREQIAAEKIPLAKELEAREQKLIALRRANDDTLRNLDTGSLDSQKTATELKLRQDEVGYVTNLLDEYARNFETRLAVGELDLYAPFIAAAKDAPGNRDLTVEQKFERQLELVDRSVRRIQESIGGVRFPGSAVDPQGQLVEGTFALLGPVALFASKDGSEAGLALAQAGTTRPAVRPLEASFVPSIKALVETGTGVFPFDATRGGALKELVQKWSLIEIFKKGGPIMWPLLVVSILALAVVLERVFFIISETSKRDVRAVQSLMSAVAEGDMNRAIEIGRASKYFVPRTLGYALEHREKSLGNALVYAQSQELKRFRRGIGVLDTAITIAPLLGLLGTVTGMMHSFSLIGGELSAPGAITGGIAEALIATAFGLMIAILCLVPYNYLNNRIEEAKHELEASSAQLELLAHPERGVVEAVKIAESAA